MQVFKLHMGVCRELIPDHPWTISWIIIDTIVDRQMWKVTKDMQHLQEADITVLLLQKNLYMVHTQKKTPYICADFSVILQTHLFQGMITANKAGGSEQQSCLLIIQ